MAGSGITRNVHDEPMPTRSPPTFPVQPRQLFPEDATQQTVPTPGEWKRLPVVPKPVSLPKQSRPKMMMPGIPKGPPSPVPPRHNGNTQPPPPTPPKGGVKIAALPPRPIYKTPSKSPGDAIMQYIPPPPPQPPGPPSPKVSLREPRSRSPFAKEKASPGNAIMPWIQPPPPPQSPPGGKIRITAKEPRSRSPFA